MKKENPFNVITRKIQIAPCYDEKEERAKVWQYFRDLNYRARKAANIMVNGQYATHLRLNELRANNPELKTKSDVEAMFREVYGCSSDNMTYRNASDILKESYVCGVLSRQVCKYFNNELSEVLKGNASLRTYKNGMPVPVSKVAFRKLAPLGNTYTFELTFGKGHKYNFVMCLGRDRSGNRAVVERIMNNELAFGDFSIMVRKNKMFLNLPVKFPKSDNVLDPDIHVGIDLGLAVPVVMCLNTNENIKRSVGSARDFLKQRMKLQQHRREMQKVLKFVKGGKGRAKKLAKLEKLKARERNFARTMNHAFSKAVIDFALKNNAGVIKMEDLSGIGKDGKNSFVLRNWSYFELQQMVEYKAKMNNITVLKVDPAYTSQTCPTCHTVTEGNRESQSKFACKNPSCSDHLKEKFADAVAAYNIANRPEKEVKASRKAKAAVLAA